MRGQAAGGASFATRLAKPLADEAFSAARVGYHTASFRPFSSASTR